MNTATLIKNMMIENTGSLLCDSCKVYGYQYERNQKGFEQEDIYKLEAYKYKDDTLEIEPVINIYPFLVKHLDRTPEAENLENIIYENLNKNNIDYYSIFEVQEQLKEIKILDPEYDEDEDEEPIYNYLQDITNINNTYNYDSILSQILQYIIFEYLEEHYILLQIHNGCDARVGYTIPRLFQIKDIDYFNLYQNQLSIQCDCSSYDYDLYEYYDKLLNIETQEPVNPEDIFYLDKNNILRCKHCNAPIQQVILDF